MNTQIWLKRERRSGRGVGARIKLEIGRSGSVCCGGREGERVRLILALFPLLLLLLLFPFLPMMLLFHVPGTRSPPPSSLSPLPPAGTRSPGQKLLSLSLSVAAVGSFLTPSPSRSSSYGNKSDNAKKEEEDAPTQREPRELNE